MLQQSSYADPDEVAQFDVSPTRSRRLSLEDFGAQKIMTQTKRIQELKRELKITELKPSLWKHDVQRSVYISSKLDRAILALKSHKKTITVPVSQRSSCRNIETSIKTRTSQEFFNVSNFFTLRTQRTSGIPNTSMPTASTFKRPSHVLRLSTHREDAEQTRTPPFTSLSLANSPKPVRTALPTNRTTNRSNMMLIQ
jgi:hypothetical protein